MAKGRKNSCPTNIRNWGIFIQDKSAVSETWVRIKGLEELTRNTDSDTEDGSAATDLWEEPYVSKRSGSLTLSGKPKVDAATGAVDPGQQMLDDYATSGVCDDDATLKIVDPYGTAIVGDFIVTGSEVSSDEDEDTKNWDLEQVGDVDTLPYVQMSSISLKDGNNAVTTLSIAVGAAAKIITIVFNPTNASNQRFRISSSNKRVASVGNITEDSFTVNPVSAGTSKITVTTVNGAKTATLTVTVTDS